MGNYYPPIIAEVRRNRAKLLEMYGGIEGLNKHMEDERPQLIKEGWKFETPEEFAARTKETQG